MELSERAIPIHAIVLQWQHVINMLYYGSAVARISSKVCVCEAVGECNIIMNGWGGGANTRTSLKIGSTDYLSASVFCVCRMHDYHI